jgi:flagellar assembly protein FliH
MSEAAFLPLFESPTDGSGTFQLWTADPADTKTDPVDEFERGLAEGQLLAETAFAEERRYLQALVAAANALQPVEPEAVRKLICETVDRLVREIVGVTQVDLELLRKQVDEAITFAGPIAVEAILKLSPDDAASFKDANLGLPVVADMRVARGTLRLESPSGTVEHGRTVQLESLRQQLGIAEDER